MSGLLIRADLGEKVLRSVGDALNGIVCIVAPDHVASWAIDSAWQPPKVDDLPNGGVVTVEMPTSTGEGAASTLVDPDGLVAGAEGPLEARGLLQMVCAAAMLAPQRWIPSLTFEPVISHLELAKATRDALERHGYLERPTCG